MPDVVVAGHICIDLFPSLTAAAGLEPGAVYDIGPLRFRAGGCVTNTARALRQLGATVALAAEIGDDELGSLLVPDLEADRLDTAGVHARKGAKTSYSIVVQLPGEDRLFWHHRGANDTFDGSAIDLDQVRILHLGYPSLLPLLAEHDGRRLVATFARARAAGVTTSLDLAAVERSASGQSGRWQTLLDAVLPVTDVFTASTVDLVPIGLADSADIDDATAAALARRFVDSGAGVAMIKRGEQGLHVRVAPASRLLAGGHALAPLALAWNGGAVSTPAFSIATTGTTGAGDAATAGLLYGVLSGRSLERSAALAAAAGAAAIERTEPGRAYDGAAELEARIDAGWSPLSSV